MEPVNKTAPIPGWKTARLFMIPLACLILGLSGLAGCTAVQPYEREHLADPIMDLDEGMEGAYEQHLHRALSQGLAGQPASGGGCGCEQ